MTRSTLRGLVALVLAAIVVASPVAARPATGRPGADPLRRLLDERSLTPAQYALQRARSLFDLAAVRREFGSVRRPHPHEATLFMRDLLARLDSLAPVEAAAARRLLARPSDGTADPGGSGYSVPSRSTCGTNVCVHWVATTADAPPPSPSDPPAQVASTLSVFEDVWTAQVSRMRYRAPKSDAASGNNGGNRKLDVYLADVGSDFLYGYCTSDDPNLSRVGYAYYDFSAYCVVDDDFAPEQFGTTNTPLSNLQVTAAHEFFHAIQFAYDTFEDNWLMEGSAAWIEDATYDDINDNYQYLSTSQLAEPAIPLDLGYLDDRPLYGSWLFWRFATEFYPRGVDFVRDVWQRADGSAAGVDMYSAQAVHAAARAAGSSLKKAYANFGVYNYAPAVFYEEGAGYVAEVGPATTRTFAVGAQRTVPPTTIVLDHLSTAYATFVPDVSIASGSSLEVSVDLPPRARGPVATLLSFTGPTQVTQSPIPLDEDGVGRRSVPLGPGVTQVVLVLSNASKRFTCWRNSDLSCQGTSRDDDLAFRFSARVAAP